MKLKCIEPAYDTDYLTAGKVYDAISSGNANSCVDIIDDDGDEINVYVPSSAHGKFEVIYED